MKRRRSTKEVMLLRRRWKWKLIHAVLLLAGIYFIFVSVKLAHFLHNVYMNGGDQDQKNNGLVELDADKTFLNHNTFHRKLVDGLDPNRTDRRDRRPLQNQLGWSNGEVMKRWWNESWGGNANVTISGMEKMANEAWVLGTMAWEEVDAWKNVTTDAIGKNMEACPSMVAMTNENNGNNLTLLPCGLMVGSSITVIGKPHKARFEDSPQFSGSKSMVEVSQFMVELLGLKVVEDGEDPPKILHLNPRLIGDWRKKPVIEHNTCYRMHWGTAQRCDGFPSKDDSDKVDGLIKCEKWMRGDDNDGEMDSKELKRSSWLKRLIGRTKKPMITWPFPFVEERFFVLTIRAGAEGYHINVDGQHITSFPYRTGFSVEDATGLVIKGNIDVRSVYVTSLPFSHLNFSHQEILDMSEKWKSHNLPEGRIDIFIGILSATNHFAERMAIRKSWMQSDSIKSSKIMARFFVALNQRKETNIQLKEESDYFGDIVILPFIDRYELLVLKTIAICNYGVQNMTAAYIMKCDDDTFVRVETIRNIIQGRLSGKRSIFIGNFNLFHKPLRSGKWKVTYEEWSEDTYPPYADGPGYVISIDIARFIATQHAKGNLKLFKMEDVSMGMWVEQFNRSTSVQYTHSNRFCQNGCMDGYYTAHYQSPRQMMCLWDNLATTGHPRCCNSK